MVQLTVGYVAGFIAAAIFVARLWSPNVLTFILSGILRDRNSAATWTAASTALQRSHWPLIVQSDSARNHSVRKDVLLVTWSISLMSFIIAIAAVVTPLGLYETLVPTDNVQTPFKYLEDVSPFGYGTPPRSNLPFNRKCGGSVVFVPIPCPFTDTVTIGVTDSAGNGNYSYPYGYDINIPGIIKDIYSSGVGNDTTISNYFDIEWRRYLTTSNEDYNNGSTYLVGAFRPMQSLVLNDAIEPVEGLLVNTKTGGIGFRNHTIPPGFQYGATWSEDILFIEPETVCVDTNTTLDYSIAESSNFSTSIIDLVLTDRGGFANANHTYPEVNLSAPQTDPELYARAWKAAWMTNVWTMFYLNVTAPSNKTAGTKAFHYINSEIGKSFALPNPDQNQPYDALAMDASFSFHLNLDGSIPNATSPGDTGLRSNPFQISGDNFTDIRMICTGAGAADYANITNIYANCGLMRGIPQRQDPGSKIIFDAGSKWSQPIYGCASTLKATIKTVNFKFNGTDVIQNLAVTNLEDKNYTDESSKPLWGVENTGNKYAMADLKPIWGLVSSEYENHPNVSTVRQEYLYLPGYSDAYDTFQRTGVRNLPGNDFYSSAMGATYTINTGTGTDLYDYSGDSNMAMWARWQDLTNSSATAGLIPNLIFTDYAAAAVVGTKGVLGPGNAAEKNVVPLPVTPTQRKIRYHWPFAIPALICLLGLALMTVAAFVAMILGNGTIGKMRLHMQKLSPGRIFTTFLHPELGGMSIPSKDWTKHLGKTSIDISGDYPFAGDVMRAPEKGASVTEYERSVCDDPSSERDGFLGSQGPPTPQPYVGVQQLPAHSGEANRY